MMTIIHGGHHELNTLYRQQLYEHKDIHLSTILIASVPVKAVPSIRRLLMVPENDEQVRLVSTNRKWNTKSRSPSKSTSSS
jgi:hypothetical protein